MSDRPVPETGKTARGFAIYASVEDTYGQQVAVVQSSKANEDCVWIQCRGAQHGPGIPTPHMNAEQARIVRAALSEFLTQAEPPERGEAHLQGQSETPENSRAVGEREERLREALTDALHEINQSDGFSAPTMDTAAAFIVERIRPALASSPSPPDLDGAECHELYSMWLAHHAAEGVDPGHPLVTAGEKLARRMDPGHPRFQAPAAREVVGNHLQSAGEDLSELAELLEDGTQALALAECALASVDEAVAALFGLGDES